MQYFQIGYDVKYYSRAYKLSRDETIEKIFTPVITTVIVLIAAWYGYKAYNKIQRRKINPDEVGDDFD